jgi:hypothetical protein
MLQLLSPTSWYIHDTILFTLEIKEGLNIDQYFGVDQRLEDYIISKDNYSLFKDYKNNFGDLEAFQEFNMKEFQLNYDYKKEKKIESNV